MNFLNTLNFAQELDSKDPLSSFRNEFIIPTENGKEVIYLCGNSLGLQPKATRDAVMEQLDNWGKYAVEGHFKSSTPWMPYHKIVRDDLARLVGAKPIEVAAMNTLTVNLHLLMVSFYRPTKKRFKIIVEASAFPSDQYAFESQARFHGYDPDEAIIEVKPRKGEYTLRTEDILSTIEQHQDSLALVLFGGVNYLSGQFFELEKITKAAHHAGAYCGFDLAHTAGNLPLKLHDWNVDFACWCSYKYLNSSPGGISGIFVHEKHGTNPETPRFAGWWGYEEKTRFQMKKGFKPEPGADGWGLSNIPVLPLAAHKASLELFDKAGMDRLRTKSELLTGYLEYIIGEINKQVGHEQFQIITPKNPKERGCQLSIICKENGRELFEQLTKKGVMGDWREPNVLRFAPVPLYNSFSDIYNFGQILSSVVNG